jgi:hypothetical protein
VLEDELEKEAQKRAEESADEDDRVEDAEAFEQMSVWCWHGKK